MKILMLYGLPIVATNVGGPSDILINNVSALLIPPKNIDALADSILVFLESSALRKKLGEYTAKELRSNWLWNKIVKTIQNAYVNTITSYREQIENEKFSCS
jgi:glycosyltransferase involved in cell wall biosynthesis